MKKIFMYKKGVSPFSVVGMTYFLLFSVVFILLLFVVFFSMGGRVFDSLAYISDDVEETLVIERLLHSCFVYEYEENGFVYSNVLDEKRLNRERLEECFSDEYKIQARIVVDLFEQEEREIPIISTGVRGGNIYEQYALIHLNDGTFTPAKLMIEIRT